MHLTCAIIGGLIIWACAVVFLIVFMTGGIPRNAYHNMLPC